MRKARTAEGGADTRPGSNTKPVKQSDDGCRLYAKVSGPKDHIFCYLLGASGSPLEFKLSNHEARRLGLEESGVEHQIPQMVGAEPWTIRQRGDKQIFQKQAMKMPLCYYSALLCVLHAHLMSSGSA